MDLKGIVRAGLVGGKALDSAIRGPEEEVPRNHRDYALEFLVRLPSSDVTNTASLAGPGIVIIRARLPG